MTFIIIGLMTGLVLVVVGGVIAENDRRNFVVGHVVGLFGAVLLMAAIFAATY